jgi:hypothetical protein
MTRMPCGRSSACQHWLMPRPPTCWRHRRRGRRALHAGRRRDVDDVARRLRFHLRHDAIGDVDQPEDIGLEHRPHRVDIESADFRAHLRGVVDEDVDPSHELAARLDRPALSSAIDTSA